MALAWVLCIFSSKCASGPRKTMGSQNVPFVVVDLSYILKYFFEVAFRRFANSYFLLRILIQIEVELFSLSTFTEGIRTRPF